MATLFLIIIYLAFISLGLPDSMLGSAWPVMQIEYGTPIEMAGVLSMVIVAGTIISSLASEAVLNRLGTGKVTFISVAITAVSLLGFSLSPSILWLAICALPLGLGAGSIDAGLNNYVATHYKAHHMSWLHCFWGVGAMLGPIIMSHNIAGGHSWRDGYTVVSMIQFGLVVVLFLTLPLWKRVEQTNHTVEKEEQNISIDTFLPETHEKPLKIKGVKFALFTFLFYVGVEATMGLWGSSFLVNVKGLSASSAAQWVSMYYAGITVGRLLTGFVTFRFSNRDLIRAGQMIALLGAILLVIPLPEIFSLIGFILVGLGSAPIFPCMLHETPVRFGKKHSQKIMGYQMAVAYVGGAILPPLLGWVAAHTSFIIFPFVIVAYIIIMLISSERINSLMNKRQTI
ncbi:MFS transporter [Paenibacillus monticola]|uniref:MFS transporter n=1 Tax=Paenibacillus monticola TaxID=2666075 RepID=A0A7X2L2M4_9BACL|nr:MFS transporter [Paenibacillus monticola]MRN54579.1 MFS transporter [Paenibacillus monticola]